MVLRGVGRTTLPKLALVVGVLALTLAAAGCSRPGPQKGSVSVEGAWARPAAKGEMSAAYFTIRNNGSEDDRLVGGSADVAGKTELHETVAAEPGEMGGGHNKGNEMGGGHKMGGGMMMMRPVEAVPVPAGGAVELKPGGLHVMLIDIKRDLKVGDAFSLALKFEKAGVQTVKVAVQQP